jgi:hypothetical protein
MAATATATIAKTKKLTTPSKVEDVKTEEIVEEVATEGTVGTVTDINCGTLTMPIDTVTGYDQETLQSTKVLKWWISKSGQSLCWFRDLSDDMTGVDNFRSTSIRLDTLKKAHLAGKGIFYVNALGEPAVEGEECFLFIPERLGKLNGEPVTI